MIEPTAIDWQHVALLIIDMQHDFAAPEGNAYINGTETVIPVVADIARYFRKYRRPVVHVVRLYLPDGSNADLCRRKIIAAGASIVTPHADGAAIIPALLPENSTQPDHDRLLAGQVVQIGDLDYTVYKPRWGAFYGTPLADFLKEQQVRSLVVVGCNFPNCPQIG